MSEYKRLTVKDSCYYDEMDNVDVDALYCRLADLEDKIESGRLVELPCKVGDTVWVINAWMDYGDTTKGEPYYVTRYELVEGKAIGFEIYGNDCRILQNAPKNGVQPYVFTNKEQAEARLKELRGEGL